MVQKKKNFDPTALVFDADASLVFGQNFVYDNRSDMLLKGKDQLKMPATSTILSAHMLEKEDEKELLLIEEVSERRERLLPGAFDRSKYGT